MWAPEEQHSFLRRLSSQQENNIHAGIVGAEDNRVHQHQIHHRHHGLSNVDVPLASNPRASRNMAEKQRRDNLNTNISTMAALVPTVAGSSRRMDKISILRLAAAFLRTQYTLGRGSTDFLPRQFNDFDLEQYFVDNLIGSAGFFIVLTSSGKIVYVSRQVEKQLGHAQNELLGQSLYNFIDPDDCEELARNLTPDEMQSAVSLSSGQITDAATDNNSNSSEDSTKECQRSERKAFKEQRRSFKLRMSQRTVSRRESIQYECLQFSGVLRLAEACRNNNEANANRARSRAETTSTSNDIVFVGMARLPKKRSITELSIIDANKEEYVTRHLVDGRIIYCDHRVSVVAGYLSEEVSGLSAFSFMHKDDFRWTMIGLRQMYDRAETCGSSCYRLLAKTGEFIYLRTHGYLEYDKGTQTVESFVCINTLVSEEEGMELMREMKERFSATVSGTTRVMIKNTDDRSFDLSSDTQKSNSSTHLEDPSQLEDAITHLISDLPSPAVSEDRLSPSPMPNVQFAKAAIFSQRFPPAATQASKIGIKKIDHYLVLQGKGNRTPKRESKMEESSNQHNQRSVNDQNPISPNAAVEQHTVKNNSTNDLTSKQQSNAFIKKDSTSITPCLDAILNTTVLNTDSMEQVLQEDGDSRELNVVNNTTETKLSQLQKQDPMLEYLKNGIDEPEIAVQADSALNRRRYSSKRMCNEENRTISTKKKRNDMQYESTENDTKHQRVASYVNCETFIKDEPFPTLVDLNNFEQISSTNSMRIRTSDSPNSSLQDINVEYQQLDPSTPLISNVDDEQFVDLQDLKEDSQLSPSLDPNPDIMLKIFDDLRPVMGFEKNLNELNVQKLSVNNQVMSNEIRRTHLQLANSMAIRESQFNALARNLENPALQAQRKNLTQLQAEHKMQKQMLKTLQQDHHNMQVNIKHNIGV